MSRENITSMVPVKGGGAVTFQLRRGGARTYYYSTPDFIAISAGADPKDFEGSQDPPQTIGSEIGSAVGDVILDIGEAML
jgi:hypothetical protein